MAGKRRRVAPAGVRRWPRGRGDGGREAPRAGRGPRSRARLPGISGRSRPTTPSCRHLRRPEQWPARLTWPPLRGRHGTQGAHAPAGLPMTAPVPPAAARNCPHAASDPGRTDKSRGRSIRPAPAGRTVRYSCSGTANTSSAARAWCAAPSPSTGGGCSAHAARCRSARSEDTAASPKWTALPAPAIRPETPDHGL